MEFLLLRTPYCTRSQSVVRLGRGTRRYSGVGFGRFLQIATIFNLQKRAFHDEYAH